MRKRLHDHAGTIFGVVIFMVSAAMFTANAIIAMEMASLRDEADDLRTKCGESSQADGGNDG